MEGAVTLFSVTVRRVEGGRERERERERESERQTNMACRDCVHTVT